MDLPTMSAVQEAKSRLMARIRSKDTRPEMLVRRELHARGLRFRLHRRDLPGTPDIVLPRHGLVIEVRGCFWHGCPNCDRGRRHPKSNIGFWSAKLNANKERDDRNIAALINAGWTVTVVWECDTREPNRLKRTLDGIVAAMQ